MAWAYLSSGPATSAACGGTNRPGVSSRSSRGSSKTSRRSRRRCGSGFPAGPPCPCWRPRRHTPPSTPRVSSARCAGRQPAAPSTCKARTVRSTWRPSAGQPRHRGGSNCTSSATGSSSPASSTGPRPPGQPPWCSPWTHRLAVDGTATSGCTCGAATPRTCPDTTTRNTPTSADSAGLLTTHPPTAGCMTPYWIPA